MKNYILILVLSFSFFISNSQNKGIDERESYILTIDGDKISIAPDFDIYLTKNSVRYCSSKTLKGVRYLKKDIQKKIPIKTYKFKYENINIKSVSKIVSQNKLYLPVEDKKVKIVYREILKNENYILGVYKRERRRGDIYVKTQRYIVVDNNTKKIIQTGRIDSEEVKDNIEEYFENCLNEEEFVVRKYREPYAKYLNGEESTTEKVEEWYKFIRGSFIHMGYLSPAPNLVLLPDYNKYECK